MRYTVFNKKLQKNVGEVNEEEKKNMEAIPMGAGKFIFRPINKAPAPKAAKKVTKEAV